MHAFSALSGHSHPVVPEAAPAVVRESDGQDRSIDHIAWVYLAKILGSFEVHIQAPHSGFGIESSRYQTAAAMV